MSKPKLCELLGVEVDEEWSINGDRYKVDELGLISYFSTTHQDWRPLSDWLCTIIEHPERIKRKPRWTEMDADFAKAIRRICPAAECIERESYEVGGEYVLHFYGGGIWRMSEEFRGCPSLKAGEIVELDEILKVGREVNDSSGSD